MKELNDAADLSSHVSGAKRSVVFFEMTGCPYCVACKARFADLVRERTDLDYVQVRLDDPGNPLWTQYHIHAVPTVLAFEKGEVIARADSLLALGLGKRKWNEFRDKI